MKKSARRMCAFVLAAAMMIPLAGCKKGKSKGKGSSGPRKDYVEEDDPYFSSNEVELKIDPPENSDKEIESQELYSPRIVGGKVMSEYYLSYKMPKDIQEKVDSFDWESGDYAEIEKIYAEYYKNGLVIFDLDGNVIKNVETEGSEGFSKIIPKKDGGFYATRYKLLDNNDECRAQVELVTIDENFEVTDSVTLDDSVQDIDKIIGVINQKDFHYHVVGTDKHISDYISPVVFVAETMKIFDLLRKMQQLKTHMAIVIDEYGDFIMQAGKQVENGSVLYEYKEALKLAGYAFTAQSTKAKIIKLIMSLLYRIS